MFGKISITVKLLTLVASAVLFTAAGVGWQASEKAATALTEKEWNNLSGIGQSRAASLEQYLASIEQDITTLSSNEMVARALGDFSVSWNKLGQSPENTLQKLYINNNPHPVGEKDKLDSAADGSAYSATHEKYHRWFREFLKARGYYDIFLVRNDGELVYTVFKELDFATNLSSGQYAQSDLGKAFRDTRQLNHGELAFYDFAPYAPSHGAPASFISTPVFDAEGVRQGALIFQMPIDRINNVLSSTVGLGNTGEAFLVGKDGKFRSDAPRAENSTLLVARVSNDQINGATIDNPKRFEGESYRDATVLSVATPIRFQGIEWFVISEITQSEIIAPVNALKTEILKWGVGILLVIGLIAAFVSNRISKPIQKISAATQKITKGEMDTVIPYQSNSDEIGPLAQAIDQFRQEIIRANDLSRQQQERTEKDKQEAERRALQGERLKNRAVEFDTLVRKSLAEFGTASRNLDENASAMSAIAEETASQSRGILNASAAASQNVQNVAAATEELSVSVGEISSKMSVTRSASEKAVHQAEIMRQRVSGMEQAANAISNVIRLITDIAGQTNLLALNATIEAARAGEAGKGFAVVASEVKALASQTSKATDDISRQITAIQETTASSVEGIQEILIAISQLEAVSTEVASAVEQQSSATLQISSSIQEAAGSVSEVDSNISGVNEAAQETGVTANKMRLASATLTEQSTILQREVESFLKDIHAA